MTRRFRPPAAIEDAPEGSAVGELSTDALHMTSPLRVGRRVGRTIYAQLGPEPSDVDPLVATADSPVLAERIVRAVNAAPPIAEQAVPRNVFEGRARDVARALGDAVEDDDVPRCYDVMGRVRELARRREATAPVAREDTASPDEAARTAPCPDCGAVVGVLDSIPSLAPVIDDHKWLGVLCSGSGTALDRPVPAQPAEAPVVQRAAPARDALVQAFFDAEVTGDFFADGQVTWHKPEEAEAERMADVALGVLRGGGADAGGEDEGPSQGDVDDLRWEAGIDGKIGELAEAAGVSRAHLRWEDILGCVRVILDALRDKAGATANDLVAPPVSLRVGVAGTPPADIARLARAAGVSPDSEDPVGAIEAAIRARRKLPEPGGTDANAGTWWEVGPLMDDIDDETWTVQARDGGVFLDGNLVPARDLALALLAAADRAPAPTPAPLTRGEVVEDPADLDRRATVGTIVEDVDGKLGKRMPETQLEGSDKPGRWTSDADWAADEDLEVILDFPVTVVRVGTGGGES